MNEIKIGDFVEFYYKNIDGGVIRESPMQIYSITESDSGYVIVVREIRNPDNRHVLLKTVDNLYIHGPSSNKYIEVKFKEPVNINRIPAEFRDLIGKAYTGPHGDIVMSTNLLNRISKDYPKIWGVNYIKKYPEEFFMDLYERRPIPDYEEDEDDYVEDYIDKSNINGYSMLADYFIKYGKVKALKQLHEGIPSDMDGEIIDKFNEDINNEPKGVLSRLIDKNLDRETKKEMIDYLLSTGMYDYPLNFLNPADSDTIEIFAQKDIDTTELNDYVNVLMDNLNKYIQDNVYPYARSLPAKEISDVLENINNYKNFFFQGFSQDDVDGIINKLFNNHEESIASTFKKEANFDIDEYDLRIRDLLERLKNPAMIKSAGKR